MEASLKALKKGVTRGNKITAPARRRLIAARGSIKLSYTRAQPRQLFFHSSMLPQQRVKAGYGTSAAGDRFFGIYILYHAHYLHFFFLSFFLPPWISIKYIVMDCKLFYTMDFAVSSN